MKIVVDATPAIKRLGGVSEYTRQLITHLSLLDHTNPYKLVSFSLFRTNTLPLPPLPANFKERQVPLPGRVIDRMWRRAGLPPLEFFSGPADLVFFPNIFISRTFHPTIVTVHDLSWLKFPQLAPPGEAGEFKAALNRVAKSATSIIAVSEATKRDLVTEAKIPSAKITVINEGYDEALLKKPNEQELLTFRERYKLGQSPYLLFVGTIEPRKNIVRLIGAFDLFKEKSKLPHKLVLLGRLGWNYRETMVAIEKSPYKSDIILLGSLPNETRRLTYHAAESVVFPSLYEGFGIPILEGQAAGKPVLTGTGGSLAEVGGESVLSVDVESKEVIARGLIRLVQDETLRENLIAKGYKNIQRFSWAAMAQETLKLFEKVGKK